MTELKTKVAVAWQRTRPVLIWACQRSVALLRYLGRGVIYFFGLTVTSAKGVWDNADVRIAVAKAFAVAGMTWAGIVTASHDPAVVGAFVTVCLGVAAGVHEAAMRKVNGS